MNQYIYPFKGLHPKPEYVADIIAPPYDVVTRAQAKQLAHNKPYDFLHISRAEIDLPDSVDEHDEKVYQQARENFNNLLQKNILVQDQEESFYIYQLQQGEHQQTGVLAKASCRAYSLGKIRRHELTRPDKVLDRSKHIETLGAQVSPTLLAHKQDAALKALLTELTQQTPLFEATLQNVVHRIWRIDNPASRDKISALLNAHETIYIADGHHRNEAAFQVFCKHPEYTDCLVAVFPEDELKILGYHRIIKKLNNETPESFLEKLKDDFVVTEQKSFEYPKQKGEIHLYLNGRAYQLLNKNKSEQLDVDILTQKILTPILGIQDIRQDTNIAFVGGQDALTQMKSHVDKGECALGFLMYPTSMQELLQVADDNKIMPPKSTWFEPKLADGLISYTYST